MPRTKIPKNTKRNREAAQREEKVRQYDAAIDEFVNSVETKKQFFLTEVDNLKRILLLSIRKPILEMKMGDYFEMLEKGKNVLTNFSTPAPAAMLPVIKVGNPNDEGYLTEDSTSSVLIHGSNMSCGRIPDLSILRMQPQQLQQQQQHRGRTPGPLSSARARRTRRSRSACNDISGTAVKSSKSTSINSSASTEHASRNKMRTPMASRKAISADRGNNRIIGDSPPAALMRWAKPGEFLLSTQGSPVVAQIPDRIANVNIPIKDGVLQMRPKILEELKQDIIDAIDPETLQQIRTLHANLDKMVNLADMALKK